MSNNMGDDQRQAASAESEDAGCDTCKYHAQQLASRELLTMEETAILRALEVSNPRVDYYDLVVTRVASALLFSDVYALMERDVNFDHISRALDDEVRDSIIQTCCCCENGCYVDVDVRSAIISEYARLINVVLPHVIELRSRTYCPDQWDDRLVAMLNALRNTSSPPGKN